MQRRVLHWAELLFSNKKWMNYLSSFRCSAASGKVVIAPRPNFDPLIDSLVPREVLIHKNKRRARVKKSAPRLKEAAYSARNEWNWHWRHVECSLRGTHGQSRDLLLSEYISAGTERMHSGVFCCLSKLITLVRSASVWSSGARAESKQGQSQNATCNTAADPVVIGRAASRSHSRTHQSITAAGLIKGLTWLTGYVTVSYRALCSSRAVMKCEIRSVMIGAAWCLFQLISACKSRVSSMRIS